MSEPSDDIRGQVYDMFPDAPGLPKRGGGGTSGGMEERVARLEKHMDQLTKDVGDLRVSVATVTENVRHLPTKPWLFTTLAMMMTALAAIVGVIVRFLPQAG